MELLVAMVLTGLIVILGMATISHFMRLFNQIKQNSERQSAIVQFYEVMKRDVNRADKVVWDETLNCIKGDQQITYQFEKEYVVRETIDFTDTLQIQSDAPEFGFVEKSGLIKHISIRCYNNGLMIPLDHVKNYPLGIILEKIE
jgi:type II secretory pathway pseudopilin PulG